MGWSTTLKPHRGSARAREFRLRPGPTTHPVFFIQRPDPHATQPAPTHISHPRTTLPDCLPATSTLTHSGSSGLR